MGKWWRQRQQFFVVVVVVCPTFLIYHLGANPLSPAKFWRDTYDIFKASSDFTAAAATIDQDDKLNIARGKDDLCGRPEDLMRRHF